MRDRLEHLMLRIGIALRGAVLTLVALLLGRQRHMLAKVSDGRRVSASEGRAAGEGRFATSRSAAVVGQQTAGAMDIAVDLRRNGLVNGDRASPLMLKNCFIVIRKFARLFASI